jgi:PAS domain S-box-containing protein
MSDQALQSARHAPAFDDMEPDERRTAFDHRLREILELRRDLCQRADERISLQVLIDQVPDFLFAKDLDSRFVIANGAIGGGYGRPRSSDLLGLTDFDLHPADVAQRFFDIEQTIMRTGESMIDMQEVIISTAGTKKWLSTTKVPLYNDQHRIVGLIGIGRDVTARKQAEDYRNGQAQILEMIATNVKLETILDHLMRLVESQSAGSTAQFFCLTKRAPV